MNNAQYDSNRGAASDAARVYELVLRKKAIVCCGSGGVGKTTTAAALGLAAAKAGRKVLVLTIDPARRLAEAMSLAEAGLRPARVPSDRLALAGIEGKGELHAWMLDPSAVFESLVRRLSSSPEAAKKILASRLYQRLSEMVAGMQEYTAAEALYDLSSSEAYDLVILDTPPSRNALEFLEAPGRLTRFLDERIVHLFLPEDGGKRSRIWKKAGDFINGLCARIFGQEFFDEMQQFLGAFSGMFSAFRIHADGVKRLLSSNDAAFLLITSPEQSALRDAYFFREQIEKMELPFAGFVLNRSWALSEKLPGPEKIQAPDNASDAAKRGLQKLICLAREELEHATKDQQLLETLRRQSPRGAIAIAAPHIGDAIEDLTGLAQLANSLTSR